MNQINFQFHEIKCTVRNRTLLRQQLLALFKRYRRTVETINYIFCSDEFLREINKNSLQHDYYTDIITFDLSEGNGIISDIYISVDRIRENALTFQVNLQDELIRVISHGALHLCGLKDKTDSDIKLMRKAEDQFIDSLKNVSRVNVSK